MSSADLYEDGFPHGTKEGYDRGCRGSACPGALEVGQTCANAKARYNGDYGYRKRVDAGMTPEQIRAEEPARPAEVKAKPLRLVEPKPVARPKLVEPTPVAADLTQWPDEEPATAPEPDLRNATADVTVDAITGKTIALEVHGTRKGYWNGCRDINCPGVERVGKSCRAALNDYTREKYRERIDRAKQAASEATADRDTDVTLPIDHHSLELTEAEQATPASVDEEPAIDVAPELSTAELAKVEAFGLHEPESLPAAELEALAADAPRHPTDYADDILERDAKIRELERQLRSAHSDALRFASVEPQRVVVPAEAGRTVTITIVVGS